MLYKIHKFLIFLEEISELFEHKLWTSIFLKIVTCTHYRSKSHRILVQCKSKYGPSSKMGSYRCYLLPKFILTTNEELPMTFR